ncbi:hypothetical protein ITJ43_07540 [Microbacterium sp. VKM Ac-2870]|uniref:hypothetical protein n=1 Tax=Microbacterium sp. VKM Ac-2870 TaxID=2783825 RepID=UPI00188C73E4|nr:hypothetical protein [Microbacterium sp. VKM Ac-2870]MBF4561991.1 hypothetical protein [Microbacterium sp. VKM Ac-2870]
MVILHRLTPAADTARTAVLLPGHGYTAQAPLLHWSGLLLAEAGWNVYAVEWTDAAADDPAAFLRRAWAEATGALERVPDLVVAKSLGTFAAPLAIAAGIPGVWLTPLVRHDIVAEALSAASDDHLVVAGTADASWNRDRIVGTRASVAVVADADHSLLIPGDWRASYAAQQTVFARIAAHVADVPHS